MSVVAMALVALPAHAQTAGSTQDLTRLTLEELLGVEFDKVYGASRYVQDVDRAPASVTIISADEITRHGYRTVAEAVESAAGFYATNDRNYSYVGVRGFGRPADFNSRVLVVVDGHRLNDNIYDAAYLGTEFPIDIGLVERIEIIRGPRSSVYGSNAFLAVINVLTRQGRDLRGPGELDVWAGSLDTVHGRATAGGRSGGVDWLVSVTGGRTSGYSRLFFPEFDTPATNHGIATDRDGEDLENVFGKFSRGGLFVTGALARRRKAIPTASFETVFNDPHTQTRDGRSYLDVEYGRSLTPQLELLIRGYVDHVGYRGDYPAPYYLDPAVVSTQADQSRGDGTGGELLVTRRLGGRQVITAGTELYTDLRQDQWVVESAAPDVSSIDERHRTRRWSAYAQDEIAINSHAIVNVGLRHDRHSTSGSTTNPRAGLNLLFGGSVLKLLYGTAYRAPNAYELFYDRAGRMAPLEPETIRTAEIVFEQRVAPGVRASAAAFHYRIANLISEVDQPAAIYAVGFANVDRVIAHGGELAVDASTRTGFSLRASQTIQDAKDTRNDVRLSNSPRYLSRVAATAPLVPGRLFAAIDGNFVGRRDTLSGGHVDGRYLQHVTVTAPGLLEKLDLALTVKNLFDRQYQDPGGAEHLQDAIIQDGRQFQLRATYRF